MKAGRCQAYISGVGSELPPRRVTTAEVEERAGINRFGFEPGQLVAGKKVLLLAGAAGISTAAVTMVW
jgi:hypothetical protein